MALWLCRCNLYQPLPAIGFLVLLTLLQAVFCSSLAVGQDDDELRTGLIATYGTGADSFQRVDAGVAFDANNGDRDERLARPPYGVRWDGLLMTQGEGVYRFGVELRGQVKIVLGDTTILEADEDETRWVVSKPLEIPFDYHPFQVEFRGGDQARLALFWSGPQFRMEPLGHRYFFHEPGEVVVDLFPSGAALAKSFRCAACHDTSAASSVRHAPALERLRGSIHRDWLIQWLEGETPDPHRNMPHFAVSQGEAIAMADYLLAQAEDPPEWKRPNEKPPKAWSTENAKIPPHIRGERLFQSIGCLACHQSEPSEQDLVTRNPHGGGSLENIAAKRPPAFFARWLSDPASLNRHHRMPIFELKPWEIDDLVSFLSRQGKAIEPVAQQSSKTDSSLQTGRHLVQSYRCHACHTLADRTLNDIKRLPMPAVSDWRTTCLDSPDAERRRPGYRCTEQARDALRTYYRRSQQRDFHDSGPSGPQLVAENNCLACHARGDQSGLAPVLVTLADRDAELAPLIPAMTPPALDQIGDKLHREILSQAIQRRGPVHREYLSVRMPRFPLSEREIDAIVDYLISADRLPEEAAQDATTSGIDDAKMLEIVGSRLVTSDGFGCTSCHQVGEALPSKAPLNARGPALSEIGKRVRRSWFDRFVNNPARIIPRMEMPAVKIAVRGVLEDDLDQQLSAVWQVLNQPGFEPPPPDPLRVVRQSGLDQEAPPQVVTDVVRTRDTTLVKPFLIGLSNRHNVLFDLEHAALAEWRLGDLALQRTEGKTWFWEAGGSQLFLTTHEGSEWALVQRDQTLEPQPRGQFLTEFDWYEHSAAGLAMSHRLSFSSSTQPQVQLEQRFTPIHGESSGFRRRMEVSPLAPESTLVFRVASSQQMAAAKRFDDGRRLVWPNRVSIRVVQPETAAFEPDGTLRLTSADNRPVKLVIDYSSRLPADQFPMVAPTPPQPDAITLDVVPGFSATRLPITAELMPTALGWGPEGALWIASLKGRVWKAWDTNGDALEDQLKPFSDELAAPYGIHAHREAVDVLNKYGLLRLSDRDNDGRADRIEQIASGWGHTTDYHDWAVGLPRDQAGNYYVALPCQQDQRSAAAAALRGQVLRLTPRKPTAENPRHFDMETITAGHRFPMGIARRRDGEIFVTDNQGNYNPFNELNHVVQGKRYGFINAFERQANPSFRPPLTPPAIDIPHPWTRSVNGICFLETPESLRAAGADLFGPFEGHLIGCEYDTRRLIRMSLQRVNDVWQGAAYPFSYEEPPAGPPLLGPLVCAVAPSGDLYVGGIRDSGWGGSNNIGEIVRLRPQMESLPAGIARVEATSGGFKVTFTKPVDRGKAARPEHYSILSYTRTSTPAYGGDDQDRSNHAVRSVEVSDDGRQARLTLDRMKTGYVYELRLQNLAVEEEKFFPAEAYYTLRQVP